MTHSKKTISTVINKNHNNMKKFIIDYTKLSLAEAMAYLAQQSLSRENYGVAIVQINDVREKLQEFLAKDNLVIDRDAIGLIKEGDTFDEHQLAFIRDEFACIMEETNNANGELDIINKCCRLLEDPEYESFEEFEKNTSGTWCEKEIE